MRKITNTQSELDRPSAAKAFLAMGMAIGGSNAIEMQESQGQQELAASSQLPTRGLNHPAFAMINVLHTSEGDPIFSDVELPKGWAIKPTSHSMWSDLIDAKGRKRGAIFYKAAFYDRSAHISPERRYYAGRDWSTDKERFVVRDNADGADLFEGDESEVESWIATNFPNWQDAAAYWE